MKKLTKEQLEQIAGESEIGEVLSNKSVLTPNELESLRRSFTAVNEYSKPKIDAEIKRSQRHVEAITPKNITKSHIRLLMRVSDVGGGLGYPQNSIPQMVQQLIDADMLYYDGRVVSITTVGRSVISEVNGRSL